VRAGLFGVRAAALPVQRIRGMVVTEPIVWRWLGWVAIGVTVAGVIVRGDEDRRLSTTLVPVARRADAQQLVRRVLPGLDLDGLRLTRSPRSARRIDPLGWRVLGLGGDKDHVATRRGILTRRTDVAPRAAVQSCGLRQGPLQRRLGLATVGLHLPSGPARPAAVHRSAAEAWEVTLTTAARRTDPRPEPASPLA
jgi:putative membrane protein